MPLYEYQCDQCGDVFELIQRFSDQPLVVHEKCGGPVHRLISVSALKFKGSGWYINDYAKSGSGGSDKNGSSKSDGEKNSSEGEKKSSSDGDKKSSSESKGGSESKSESSKPAASTPTSGDK